MRNLIYDSRPIQAAFLANNDDTVLTLLNTATEKVIVHPMVNVNVIVEAENESFAGDFIRSMSTQIASLNASAVEDDKRLAAILQVYSTQLSGNGIDLTLAKVRSKISDALQAQGWNSNKRNRILDLGYVIRSKPQVKYGRAAVQADIDAVRADDAARAEADRIEQFRQDFEEARGRLWWDALNTGNKAALIAGMQSHIAELEA